MAHSKKMPTGAQVCHYIGVLKNAFRHSGQKILQTGYQALEYSALAYNLLQPMSKWMRVSVT